MKFEGRTMPRAALLLTCGLMLACGKDGGSGTQTDYALLVLSGDVQSARVGEELPLPVEARLVDGDGKPVKGQAITFKVTSGGGSVFAGAANTNADGIVRERWTLGLHTSEAQTLEARTIDSETGEPLVLATFSAIPLPLDAVTVEPKEGLSGTAGGLVVAEATVRDVHGNPVPGAQVGWASRATTADRQAVPVAPTSSSDALGIARMEFRLPEKADAPLQNNPSAGGQVSVAGVSQEFGIWTRAGEPVSLQAVTVVVGGLTLGTPNMPPDAVARDRFGNPVGNTPVTLRVVEGGGLVGGSTQLAVNTEYDGHLSLRDHNGYYLNAGPGPWTFGATPGPQALTASLPNGFEVRFSARADNPFLEFVTPAEGTSFSGDSLRVESVIAVEGGVRESTVSAAGREAALGSTEGFMIYPRHGRVGTLDLTGVPAGPLTLTIRVRDTRDQVVTKSITVTKL